jgi:squalene-associated FAD-dependent desaturase
VSALNETLDRLGLKYARKVFVDGFLRDRHGFDVSIPVVPLARLYGDELQNWYARHGVNIALNASVSAIEVKERRVALLRLRDGREMAADWYVSAVPFDRLLELLPREVVGAMECFQRLRQLEVSPITSIHLWFDRHVMDLPHAVLVDCLGHWVFNRGKTAAGEHYLQVVISAARSLKPLGRDEIERRIVDELKGLFPEARAASVLRSRVVTEHRATFSAVPDVDRLRPTQKTPIANLLLAGDWTITGWPATMEGAVRSGYLAAEAIPGG